MARRSKVGVVHESPHRIIDLLQAVQEVLPNTLVSASCDLTKKYEKTVRGTVSAVLAELEANPKAEKGEYCIAFQWAAEDIPQPEKAKSELSLEAQLFDGLVRGLSMRDAVDELVAKGERKNAVKAASLNVKNMLEG